MRKNPDRKVIPPARGKQTRAADFERNRDGLYGGLPKARDPAAAKPGTSHPPRNRKTESKKSRPARG